MVVMVQIAKHEPSDWWLAEELTDERGVSFNFLMTSESNHSQFSFPSTDHVRLRRDEENSFDFEEGLYWNASSPSQSAQLRVLSVCYEEPLPLHVSFCHSRRRLCSSRRSCHQTPILLKRGDLWWKWSRPYLCQLTMLRLLLFPLQESQVTSDRCQDHVYVPHLADPYK